MARRSAGAGRGRQGIRPALWSAAAPIRRTRSNRAGSPRRCPAVYTGEGTRAFREWLGANSYRGQGLDRRQLRPGKIEDYYLTPWDLGYGLFVKFDHDFIGREALEKIADGPHRKKVTLALDNEDVRAGLGRHAEQGRQAPSSWNSRRRSIRCTPIDTVPSDGKQVGVSTWIGYSFNEGKMLTLAMLDAECAEPGTEVTLVWGEPNGGTSKPTVEPHVQTEIRAIVSPVPYAETARKVYADTSWRTHQPENA